MSSRDWMGGTAARRDERAHLLTVIRCVRMSPYSDGVRTFVDVQQVLPLPEAADYFVSLREKKEEGRQARRREVAWSGLWFVNVGMDRNEIDAANKEGKRYHRQWDFCREYGYLSAGGGLQCSDPLKKLESRRAGRRLPEGSWVRRLRHCQPGGDSYRRPASVQGSNTRTDARYLRQERFAARGQARVCGGHRVAQDDATRRRPLVLRHFREPECRLSAER